MQMNSWWRCVSIRQGPYSQTMTSYIKGHISKLQTFDSTEHYSSIKFVGTQYYASKSETKNGQIYWGKIDPQL